MFDEPHGKERLAKVKEIYAEAKLLNAYHPVFGNYTLDVVFSGELIDPETGYYLTDLLSITYYPVACLFYDPPFKMFWSCADIFDRLFETAKREGKVVSHFSQAYGYGGDWWFREPTPAEEDYLIYLPLIHGNRSVIYFSSYPKVRALWKRIQEIGLEIRELSPVIFSEEIAKEVIYNRDMTIHGILRKREGKFYLITVNSTNRKISSVFDLSLFLGLKAKGEATVLFEGRKLRVDLGRIEDNYLPFERHVYEITLQQEDNR